MRIYAALFFVCAGGLVALAMPNITYAQEPAAAPGTDVSMQAELNSPEEEGALSAGEEATEEINPSEIPSLVFTFWEHNAIKDARRSRGLVRAPTDAELTRDLNKTEEERLKPPPEKRDISLSGIAYVTGSDWTIWLNGMRVTPEALPPEVLDLRVYKEYIELKWLDEYTNQIFPIRLRPHQRFNIDTRIFLPG